MAPSCRVVLRCFQNITAVKQSDINILFLDFTTLSFLLSLYSCHAISLNNVHTNSNNYSNLFILKLSDIQALVEIKCEINETERWR